jgi:hypothetical protein
MGKIMSERQRMNYMIRTCPECDGLYTEGAFEECRDGEIRRVCCHCALRIRARSKRTLINDLKSVGTEGEDDEVKETRIL